MVATQRRLAHTQWQEQMCREQQRQLTTRPIFRFTRHLRQLLAKNDTCYLPASPHMGGAERRLFQHRASLALRRIRSPSRGLLSPLRSKFAGMGQLSTIRARILDLTWRYLRRCCCCDESMSQKARHVHRSVQRASQHLL